VTEKQSGTEIVKFLQILFSDIAFSSVSTAATASTKHFGVKLIKYFAVLCINAAVIWG